MRKLVLGAAVTGVAFIGIRAVVRHCRTMCKEHGGETMEQSCQCG